MLIADYREMLRIRSAEEMVFTLSTSGMIAGSVHLCIGQEAIPVGVVGERRADDPVFATYRGHGWALACGLSLDRFFAELCGRESGVNGGRAGSAMLSDADSGFYGETSIVGAGAPIAAGAALSSRFLASGRVAICAFGDGALNQGAVHEALNFAAVFQLPVVFVCENNLYSEMTPISAMVRTPALADRATAYGLPGVRVDGNDVASVREAARAALARARSGGGPTLIEAITYRLAGHYQADPQTYRSAGEVEKARGVEPLVVARRRLVEMGAPPEDLDQLEEEVRQEVRSAADTATGAPLASADPLRGVYAEYPGNA